MSEIAPKESSLFVSVWWLAGEKTPRGILVQTSATLRERRLIPWAVLPGRARAQCLELVEYAGVRPQKAPEPDNRTPLPFEEELQPL